MIAHIVAYDHPGSAGGFDWRLTTSEADEIERDVRSLGSVQSGECGVGRFTVEVPDHDNADLDARERITADLDARIWSGEFDHIIWPTGRPTP